MDEQSQQHNTFYSALWMILYICAWVDQNSLLLNTLKCCYLLFSRKPTPTLPSFPLLVNNTVLHMAKEFKYLGVTFSLDASWTPHINTICLKTRKLVGMLFQKFYCHTDSHSLLKLYQSTVRTHLEYASSVWDPYLKKNIDAIEHVQKSALKSLPEGLAFQLWHPAKLCKCSPPSCQEENIEALSVIYHPSRILWVSWLSNFQTCTSLPKLH